MNNFSQSAASTSTPNSSSYNNRFPGLRIAPFAKESPRHATQDHSPPFHQLRIAKVQTACDMIPPRKSKSSNAAFKPQQQQQQQQVPINTSRATQEISRLSNITGGQLRLKNTPLRKTPISMRAENIIPDLLPINNNMMDDDYNGSTVPNSKKFQKRALRDAKMAAENMKKRRIESMDGCWNISSSSTRAAEAQRNREEAIEQQQFDVDHDNFNNGDYNDNAYDDSDNIPNAPIIEKAEESTARVDMKLFSAMFKEFQTSLCEMQREMLSIFHKNQLEMARKEHEFQIKHDMLMLQNFKKQSQTLWKAARTHMENAMECKKQIKESKEQACQTDLDEVENTSDIDKTDKSQNAAEEIKCPSEVDETDTVSPATEETHTEETQTEETQTEEVQIEETPAEEIQNEEIQTEETQTEETQSEEIALVEDSDSDENTTADSVEQEETSAAFDGNDNEIFESHKENDNDKEINNDQEMHNEAQINTTPHTAYNPCQIMQRACLAE